MAGQLVHETFDYDAGRQVTLYVPSEPADSVVFAGDGQLVTQWGAQLDRAGLRSTMLVGAHRAGDDTVRLQEYSPALDPERFAAHEEFFVEQVRRWVRGHVGAAPSPERTALFGVSASGELALALGLRHPDIYGSVLCASPGAGFRPPAVMPRPLPRTYLVAGSGEPFFLANAARWETALAGAGAEVVRTERAGTHGGPFWQAEFPLMVAWAFR